MPIFHSDYKNTLGHIGEWSLTVWRHFFGSSIGTLVQKEDHPDLSDCADGSGLPDLMIISLPMNNRHLSPPRPMFNAHSRPKSCEKCRLYSCTSGVLGAEINGTGA